MRFLPLFQLNVPFFLCSLSGVLIGLSFPGSVQYYQKGLWWLSPVALVPLLIGVHSKYRSLSLQIDPRSYTYVSRSFFSKYLIVFLYVWWTGFLSQVISFRWIRQTMILYGGIPEWLSFILFVLYAILSGLFWPILLTFVILGEGLKNRYKPFFNSVSLAVMTSFLELIIPRFFRWQFGQLFSGVPHFIQIASIGGAGLLSFCLFFSNILTARIILSHISFFFLLVLKVLLFLLFFWGSIYGVGFYRLASDLIERPSFRIFGVQPNYSFKEFFRHSLPFENKTNFFSQKKLLSLTQHGLTHHAVDLIIWPESSFSKSEISFEDLQKLIQEQWKTPLLLQRSITGSHPDYIQSAALFLSADGKVLSSYSKRLAMPVGETIPFEKYWPRFAQWLREHINNISTIEVGTEPTLHSLSSPPLFFASTICFEIISSKLIKDFFKNEYSAPHVLISLMNLVWMGESAAGELMKTVHQFRAVEFGRSVISLANTGPSFVFDAYGREISNSLPLMTEGTIVQDVPLYQEWTLFLKYGYQWIFYVFSLNLLYVFVVYQRQRQEL